MRPRLDHVGLDVSDYETSKAFYEKVLAPLGMSAPDGAGGRRRRDSARTSPSSGSASATAGPTAAYTWRSRPRIAKRVDAFHAAAIEAGGTDNGGPGLREIYHPDYYGAFVLDPDGNNVEAVCHQP